VGGGAGADRPAGRFGAGRGPVCGGAGGGVLPAGALEAIKSIFSGKGGGRGRVSGYAPGGGGSTVFDFIKSQPGYQFGMDQGQQRLDRQYAMTGVGPTGAENIALAGYGQQYAGDYYQKLVSNLMGASGSGQTGSSTSSQSTGASPIPGAIGTIAAALISDKNLKTNIKHIDTINGIKIYSFNYIWSYIKSIGVMAQDLLKMPQYKDAVHMTSIGYVVDYSKLPI
jgi:hypothetical protein